MIYLHVPFCRSFCIYCDFYSEIPDCFPQPGFSCARGKVGAEAELFRRFGRAVRAEVASRSGAGPAVGKVADAAAPGNDLGGSPVMNPHSGPNTLYVGGGTPSVLPVEVLEDFVQALSDHGYPGDFEEFTVEVNPDDIVRRGPSYVEALLSLGVNRISMGIQSFDDGILHWMNRRHDSSMAVRAYGILRETGVENISIDLIFGLSQLSSDLWNRTLDQALNLPGGLPEHISAYQLSVEPGSVLAELVASGKYEEASDDVCAAQYAMLCDRLREAGYEHYEISNFARPGRRAVHNSGYWSGASYLGFGPGAHSFDAGRGVRSWNRACLTEYLAAWSGTAQGSSSAAPQSGLSDSQSPSDHENLTEYQRQLERVMLALRTSDGIPASELETIAGPHAVAGQLDAGNLEPSATAINRLRIPEGRFFVSDAIIAALTQNCGSDGELR